MVTLTFTFKPDSKFPFDPDAVAKAFKGMRTVFDYAKGEAQAKTIFTALVGLAAKKDKTLSLPLKNASYKLEDLPADESARSGEHLMKIMVDKKEVSKNTVWINRPATGINVGISGATSSEKAIAALIKNKEKIEGLVLAKPDGQHPDAIRWSLGSASGSLPTSEHGKKDGKEKAALDVLKRAMKEAGYS